MNKKKVLIVTYYWPPSGGGGVQRWLKMCKYLNRSAQWSPIVYTPENPFVGEKDHLLLDEVSSKIKVLKTRIWEPYRLVQQFSGNKRNFKQGVVTEDFKSPVEKVLMWVRRTFFVPDPRVFWVKPSIKYLKQVLKEENIDVIVTTGPPHSMHLIGLGLKKTFNHLKWIVDFRDPWSEWDVLHQLGIQGKSLRRHQHLEQEVINSCDLLITVSAKWSEDLKSLGAKRVEVITNGFDAEDFLEVPTSEIDIPVVAHYGLLNKFRDYDVLWKALDELSSRIQFKLVLGGIVGSSVVESIKSYPQLFQRLSIVGYLSHQEVVKRYGEASLLLLLSNNSENAEGHLPGKLFEYMGAKKPVLAIGSKNSDLKYLIDRCELGYFHDFDDLDHRQLLQSIFDILTSENKFDSNVAMFERKVLTDKLIGLMNGLLND